MTKIKIGKKIEDCDPNNIEVMCFASGPFFGKPFSTNRGVAFIRIKDHVGYKSHQAVWLECSLDMTISTLEEESLGEYRPQVYHYALDDYNDILNYLIWEQEW